MLKTSIPWIHDLNFAQYSKKSESEKSQKRKKKLWKLKAGRAVASRGNTLSIHLALLPRRRRSIAGERVSPPNAAPPPPSTPPPPHYPHPLPPLPLSPSPAAAAASASASAAPLRRRPLRRHRRPLGPHPGALAAAALHLLLPFHRNAWNCPRNSRPPVAALSWAPALRGGAVEDRRRGFLAVARGGGSGSWGLAVGEPGRGAAVRAPVGGRRREQVEAAGRVARRLLPQGWRHRRVPPRSSPRQVHVSAICWNRAALISGFVRDCHYIFRLDYRMCIWAIFVCVYRDEL